jgi:hypothetical protein
MHRELTQAPKELMRMQQDAGFATTLQQLAGRYLHRDRVRQRGFFDFADVERIRKAARTARHPETSMRLWTLIVTEIWAEMYLDARGRRPEPASSRETQSARAPALVWNRAPLATPNLVSAVLGPARAALESGGLANCHPATPPSPSTPTRKSR